MTPPRWLAPAARAVFLLLAVALLLLALRGQTAAVLAAVRRVGLLAGAVSLLAALAGLLASALAWRAVLADLGSPLPLRVALHVFFLGQLGKYVPGSVFAVAAQMELGRNQGVPRARVGTASLVFMAVLVAGGLATAVIALPFSSPSALQHFPGALLLLPVLVVCLAPPVLTRLVAVLLRLLHRDPLERDLSAKGIGRAVGWTLLMWGCYGLHVLMLVLAVPHSASAALPLAALGGYALAWTAGFLVLVAPAGAGVREATLILVLLPVVSRPAATAVAILSRGIMTVGDLVWGALGAALRPRPTEQGADVGSVGAVQQLGKAADG